MPIVTARPKPRMKGSHFEALERLARSSLGSQGIGACPRATTRASIRLLGFAEQVKGEKPKIMALTLRGFRALEEERNERILDIIMGKRPGAKGRRLRA